MGTVFKDCGSALPAPRKEHRGGAGGKHAREANLANPTFDGPPGFGPANARRDFPGPDGPGKGPLLKGMTGKRL